MKRGIIVIFVVLAVGAGLWWRSNATAGSPTGIETAQVKKSDFIQSVSSSGKTKAAKSVDLKFQTSGKLTWVGVQEGNMVRPYQAIASMDVREVQKNLEKALRDYSSERSDFDEGKSLQFVSDAAKRILQKNQWDLEKAVLDVELKHLAVEYATLVTPIGGIVTHIDTPVAGINITPATAVFRIADPASLVFEANIDEIDVGKLRIGQPAQISLDAFADATFSGRISYVSYVSETSGGGATVFPVKIAFDEPQPLRIGLNGDVTIELERQEQVLVIPIEALRQDDAGNYVYRKNGQKYERVQISIAAQSDDDAVVADGLAPGDLVVTKGFSSISQ